MAFKKIDKEFCLTDNSVNCYSFRLLSEGLQLDRFKPAIGYLMHQREKGVAVKWEDFRFENDKLYAKPVVNETLFPDLAEQIEAGFYECASVGHIVALEVSDDANLKLEGQQGVTVTKWFPRECSIVDLGGNFNAVALAKLYDLNDNVLHDLSANPPKQILKTDMKQIQLTVAQLTALNLKAESPETEVAVALENLIDKAKKYDSVNTELQNLKAESSKKEVTAILDAGVKDRKITVELSAKLAVDYATNPTGLKALVDAMPVQTLVTDKLTDDPDGLPAEYKGKTFQDLYMVEGAIADIKKRFPDYYKKLVEPK